MMKKKSRPFFLGDDGVKMNLDYFLNDSFPYLPGNEKQTKRLAITL